MFSLSVFAHPADDPEYYRIYWFKAKGLSFEKYKRSNTNLLYLEDLEALGEEAEIEFMWRMETNPKSENLEWTNRMDRY